MKDINKVFEKDFKNMMKLKEYMTLNMRNGRVFDVQEIPILEGVGQTFEEVVDEMYLEGIVEPYFESLNGTKAILLEDKEFKKPFYNEDGSIYKRDGVIKYRDVVVRPGFVAIKSPINIGLKSEIEVRGKIKPHTPTIGYEYIGLEVEKDIKLYTYIISKENLRKLNYCALVVSHTLLDRYYGYKVAFTNGYYLNLLLIPFNNAKSNPNIKIIGIKTEVDFEKDITKLFEFWISKGIIFHPYLTEVEMVEFGVSGGAKNLGIQNIMGNKTLDSYVKIRE